MAKYSREYDFLASKKFEVKYEQFHLSRNGLLNEQGDIKRNPHCPSISSTVTGTGDKPINEGKCQTS